MDENQKISFVYTDYYKVDMRGVKIKKIKLDNENTRLEYGAGINFRSDVLRTMNGFDPNLRNCEDFDLLIRLKKKGLKGFYLPVPLYRYYIHGKNITLTKERQLFKKKVRQKYGI